MNTKTLCLVLAMLLIAIILAAMYLPGVILYGIVAVIVLVLVVPASNAWLQDRLATVIEYLCEQHPPTPTHDPRREPRINDLVLYSLISGERLEERWVQNVYSDNGELWVTYQDVTTSVIQTVSLATWITYASRVVFAPGHPHP